MHSDYAQAVADARMYDATHPSSRLARSYEELGRRSCRCCGRPWDEHPPGETGSRCPDGGPLAYDRAGRERWETDGGR